MYKNSLDIIEQHGFTEGSKYVELARLNIQQNKDEEGCRKVLVEKYNLMKPKEFKSKWNRFMRIKTKVQF